MNRTISNRYGNYRPEVQITNCTINHQAVNGQSEMIENVSYNEKLMKICLVGHLNISKILVNFF